MTQKAGRQSHPFIHIQRAGASAELPRVSGGEAAGLGHGPPSPDPFHNNTKEFRTQIADHASGTRALKKEVRLQKTDHFIFPDPK